MILGRAGQEAAAELAACHALSFDSPWSAGDIETLLATSGGYALAVRDDAGVRAFLLARAIAGEAEILTLAVDPPQRRQGLARALVEAASVAASAAGAEAMFLEVAADNLAAIGLYGSVGFERVGLRRGYYARPGGAVDALVLRRALNRPAG